MATNYRDTMKILLPFYLRNENDHKLDSPSVSGGVERFCQLIYTQSGHEVIPLYFTDDDRKKRRVTDMAVSAITVHKPDVLISNYDTTTLTTNIQKILPEVPVLWITHTAAGGINKLKQVCDMGTFMENGGTVSMVSPWMLSGFEKLYKRLTGRKFSMNGDFINPAFCTGDEKVSYEIEWDITTIGRVDKIKDPFLLPKLSTGSGLKSLVMTSNHVIPETQREYYEDNLHWKYPEHVVYNLPHSGVMDNLSKSRVYFSTCPIETWGITALEAFARGVPVILIHGSTNKYYHASQDIAPYESAYAILNKKKTENLMEAYDFLRKTVDRNKLSDYTLQKHSKDNWLKSLNHLLEKTISNNSSRLNNNKVDSLFR